MTSDKVNTTTLYQSWLGDSNSKWDLCLDQREEWWLLARTDQLLQINLPLRLLNMVHQMVKNFIMLMAKKLAMNFSHKLQILLETIDNKINSSQGEEAIKIMTNWESQEINHLPKPKINPMSQVGVLLTREQIAQDNQECINQVITPIGQWLRVESLLITQLYHSARTAIRLLQLVATGEIAQIESTAHLEAGCIRESQGDRTITNTDNRIRDNTHQAFQMTQYAFWRLSSMVVKMCSISKFMKVRIHMK